MGPARWLALSGLLGLALRPEGRLVGDGDAGFGECGRFFYAGTPPAGAAAAGHVSICQRARGAARFATLYSTRQRVPVYSAFRAPRPAPPAPAPRGQVEPQVSGAGAGEAPLLSPHPSPPRAPARPAHLAAPPRGLGHLPAFA